MDGAKKTLLATVFTAAIMVASAAAYAGVISVPEFNLSIPTPDQSAPSQPGQNMAIPTIPSGTQIPTTTQLPPSVAALPSIATSGQSGVPIYGNPVPSTDSTGASGVPQNLASSCYASGGSWNPSTSTCSTNSTSSFSSQCAQMGGQYDWTKNQCQMASLPGSGVFNPYGWTVGYYNQGSSGSLQVLPNGQIYVYGDKGQLLLTTSTAVSKIYLASRAYGWVDFATPDLATAEIYVSNSHCYSGAISAWVPGGSLVGIGSNYGGSCN